MCVYIYDYRSMTKHIIDIKMQHFSGPSICYCLLLLLKRRIRGNDKKTTREIVVIKNCHQAFISYWLFSFCSENSFKTIFMIITIVGDTHKKMNDSFLFSKQRSFRTTLFHNFVLGTKRNRQNKPSNLLLARMCIPSFLESKR